MKHENMLRICLLGILILYSFVLSRYFDYVPIWDSQANAHTLISAVKKPFNFFNFELSSHPVQAYFFLLALGQYIDPGNILFFHWIDMLLGILSICAFYGILHHISSSKTNGFENILTTALFAFYPILTSNALNITYDFALTVYMVIALFCLLTKRYFFTAFLGLCMIFSKEPGIVIYGIMIVLYYFFFIGHKMRLSVYSSHVKEIAVVFFPYILLSVYALVKAVVFNKNVFFSSQFTVFMNSSSYAFLWPTWDISKVRLSYFVTIFLINFNWIITLVILSGLVRFVWLLVSRRRLEMLRTDTRTSIFVFTLFIPIVAILAYVKIFTNTRYFLPAYPIMILLFYIFLQFLPNVMFRRAVLTGVTILFFISNFYTIDPVSKKIFGTFQFGNHDMLKMTSITGECCGYGRDQLVYNFQFTYIERLTNKIFVFYRADEHTAFATDRITGNFISDASIDKATYRRTLRSKNIFSPLDISWNFFSPAYPRPDKAYFIDYPYIGRTDDLEQFLTYYEKKSTIIFEMDGYKLPVYTLVRKT